MRRALTLGATMAALGAAPASAAVEYDPGTAITPAENPVGLAVDQTSGNLHAAQIYRITESGVSPGQILRFSAAGTALTSFGDSGCCYFSGVAVNPTNQHVYGYNALVGSIETFDAAGVSTGNFTVDTDFVAAQHIATGPDGSIYFPNVVDDTVEVFSASGTLLDTISGTGEDAFVDPMSVAVNTAGDVFVADSGNSRVLEFPAAGGDPTVAHTGSSQSVALDRSTGELLVLGNDGPGFHVTVYDSAGAEVVDFGAGEIPTGLVGNPGLAVDEDDGRVYVGNDADAEILTFDRVESSPPVATTGAASSVTQTTATLNGTVDPNGFEVTAADCEFEYVADAQFDQNGFADAASVDCSSAPGDGDAAVPVSAAVSGLTAGTEYHVRLSATNDGGTDTGDDVTFQTSNPTPPDTCATNPALCPPQTCATNAALCPPQTCATNAALCPKPPPAGTVALAAKQAAFAGGSASVKLKCDGGACSAGTITLKAKIKSGKGKNAKTKTVTIGSATVEALASGKTATVKVKLNRKAKGVLAKTGSLKATVSGALTAKITIKGGKAKPKSKKKRG